MTKRQSCEDIDKKNYFGQVLTLSPDDVRLPRYHDQRKRRGFDDTEAWDLRGTIYKFVLPRLKRYKELSTGYPESLMSVIGSYPEIITTSEQNRGEVLWHYFLSEMIYAVEFAVNHETLDDRAEKGLVYFHQYFDDLSNGY